MMEFNTAAYLQMVVTKVGLQQLAVILDALLKKAMKTAALLLMEVTC